MIRLLLLAGLLGFVTNGFAEPGAQPDSATIPLNTIWAWSMPGTRALRISAKRGQPQPREATLVKEIRHALSDIPAEGEPARAGFAVKGNELDALREAHAVIVGGKAPRTTFHSGDDVSVVFFSYQAGVYVHIREVRRQKDVVEVNYQLIPHFSREATEHFAIIPLGKSLTGDVQVKITQLPLEPKVADTFRIEPIRPELADRIVCSSFSFKVDESNNN